MSDTKKPKFVAGRIKLEDVRLSFAQDLFSPGEVKNNGEVVLDKAGEPVFKFSSNFLIQKDGESTAVVHVGEDKEGRVIKKRLPIMDALKRAKLSAIAKKLGEEKAKELKIRSSAYAVKDGDEENYDGYANNYYVSANNTKKPQVIGRDKRELKESDGVVYSGCHVNAVITLWYQPAGTKNGNPVPHAVYASLEAVQFVRDGEAFGAAGVDVDEDFDDITDDDDDIDGGEVSEDDDDEDVL